jgi:hypothetical protein
MAPLKKLYSFLGFSYPFISGVNVNDLTLGFTALYFCLTNFEVNSQISFELLQFSSKLIVLGVWIFDPTKLSYLSLFF